MFDRLFREFDQILVLDTETTGISPVRDEIIELGMASLSPRGEVEADFLIALSEGKLLPPEITRLTGITPARLASEGVPKAEAAEAFAAMIGEKKTLIAAYNAQFDLNFLFYFLKREGKADSLRGVRFLDVLTVYRDRMPYPHRLGDADNAHRLGIKKLVLSVWPQDYLDDKINLEELRCYADYLCRFPDSDFNIH